MGPEERERKKYAFLLGYSGLLLPNAAGLPGLGVPCRKSLLVHQRDDLPRKTPGKLGSKNEDLPEMRGFYLDHETFVILGKIFIL